MSVDVIQQNCARIYKFEEFKRGLKKGNIFHKQEVFNLISFKQRSMKFVTCLLFLGLMLSIKAIPAFADAGFRTATSLNTPPLGVAIDGSGNLYIAAKWIHSVIKVDAATGSISTVAGNGSAGYSGDGGSATNAKLNYPLRAAVDSSGNLYICDSSNKLIRKVDHATGNISTFAGNGNTGYSGDGGAATSASIDYPQAVAVDSSGNLYIAQTNNSVIRKVDHATGKISTVAGIGTDTYGYSGDGGLATSAKLKYPNGMAVDSSGNLYIADAGNNCIRKVDHANKIISTVAGTGTQGYSGDGGAATSAKLNKPRGVAVDSNGNLYIADSSNSCVRMVDTNGNISTVVGSVGTESVAVDSSGYLYIADYSNNRILTNAPDPTPTVTGISPSSGPAGTQVTISGTGFTSDSTVYISIMTMSTQCTNVQYINSNTLTAIMPTANTMFGIPQGTIYVSNSHGSSPMFNPIALFAYTASITPAYTVTASPATATPTAGANNVITLTVQNSDGSTDTTFNGNKNVTVSGYTAAPDGSYGSFNGTTLTASPNTISVPFTSGVASPNLVLNNASTQTIGFSIAGVNTPATNNGAITPALAGAGVMVLTQDITAPATNGDQFAQQPKVTLKDSFGNICTNDSTTVVTASKKDGGAWTLTGTDTATATAGVATFINLGASNAAAVTGVQLAFDATGLTQITSLSVNLPAPATAPSSDTTLKATSTVKGQTVASLGTPSATLGSVTAGAVTITAAKAADTTEATTFVTLFDKNDAGATVKAVKYATGGDTSNFATDTAYTNAAITDGDFFIIQVTAADTTTVNYYKVVVTVTPAAPEVTLSSIMITTPAIKLSYTVGDALELTGLVVTGTYSDSSTQVETVTAANVTGFNSSAVAANQVLTITIGGKTTSYTVNIVEASANQILTSSNANVTIDHTGMKITYPMYSIDGTDFTQLANIKSVIAAASGYTYEIYQADGTTVATAMEVTNVLKVLQGGNVVETYTFAANIKYGDVNGDGALNTADLTLLQRYIVNSTNYPFEKAYGIKAADINKDNVVNSSDKLMLQRYLNNAQNYPIPSPTEFLYNPI